ncbi:MAG: hypothetical protein JEZ03_04240 [Bacteroidales bacterium]|nr:hypothetical protein [Bacteroidales bacterium]
MKSNQNHNMHLDIKSEDLTSVAKGRLRVAILIFILSITSGINSPLFSQIQSEGIMQKENYYDSIEQKYGLDDMLINGEIYFPRHPMANGHAYMNHQNWQKGYIKIGPGLYDNLELKYDIETDQLILNSKTTNKGSIKIILNESLVDEFQLGSHHFINSRLLNITDAKSNYYELIYKGEFTFIKNHKIVFQNIYNNFNPYGKYSEPTASLYITENNQFSKISSKKAFLNYFKPHKKELRKFLRKNKIKYKKATNYQFIRLLKYCDSIYNND